MRGMFRGTLMSELEAYFKSGECCGDCKNERRKDDRPQDPGPAGVEVDLKIFKAEPEDKEVIEVGDQIGQQGI